MELATLESVSWLNNHRSLEPMGYLLPADTEANCYRQLTIQAASMAT